MVKSNGMRVVGFCLNAPWHNYYTELVQDFHLIVARGLDIIRSVLMLGKQSWHWKHWTLHWFKPFIQNTASLRCFSCPVPKFNFLSHSFSFHIIQFVPGSLVINRPLHCLCVFVRVCVCVKEREREKERGDWAREEERFAFLNFSSFYRSSYFFSCKTIFGL